MANNPKNKQKWTDEEIRVFQLKDNIYLYQTLLNLWGNIYQGKEKEPDWEKINQWFKEVKNKSEENIKGGNGFWFCGTWYEITDDELAKKILELIEPF